MKVAGDGFLERLFNVLSRERELIVELQAIAVEKQVLCEEFQDHINRMRVMTDRLHSTPRHNRDNPEEDQRKIVKMPAHNEPFNMPSMFRDGPTRRGEEEA